MNKKAHDADIVDISPDMYDTTNVISEMPVNKRRNIVTLIAKDTGGVDFNLVKFYLALKKPAL